MVGTNPRSSLCHCEPKAWQSQQEIASSLTLLAMTAKEALTGKEEALTIGAKANFALFLRLMLQCQKHGA